jgi:hypothetical protein
VNQGEDSGTLYEVKYSSRALVYENIALALSTQFVGSVEVLVIRKSALGKSQGAYTIMCLH